MIFKTAFQDKISNLNLTVDSNVYNGCLKINSDPNLTITEEVLRKAFSETKLKTSCGHKRVPMRIYKDSLSKTLPSILSLFQKIFRETKMPHIWKISRTIPIHKKGSKTDAANYKPISNLCSLAKIYKRCLLQLINEIQTINNIDLTGENQFGFKKKSSTTHLALDLQNRIASDLDEGKSVAVLSLDLSSAFDVVDIETLIKRLQVMGLPINIINQIKKWLSNRSAYIETLDNCSEIYNVNQETVQGSVMGPMFFLLFISPSWTYTTSLPMQMITTL